MKPAMAEPIGRAVDVDELREEKYFQSKFSE